MKLAIATVATLLATNVSAESIVSFGGEMDANYAVDAERMTVDIEPAITLTPTEGLNFVTSTELALWDDELVVDSTLDVLPTLEFELNYTTSIMDSVEWYAKTKYNLDTKAREEINVGATFSF